MLRTFISLIVSAAILAGAYVYTFGVPPVIAAYFGAEVDAEAVAAPSGRPAGPAFGGRGGGRASSVVLNPLELRPYSDVLRAIGSATALRSTTLIANVAGEVTAVNLAANGQVSAGDMLVALDARTETLNAEIAQAELTHAHEIVARLEQLLASGSSTVTGVALSEAQLALRLAEAKAGLAQVSLESRTIRAPISGRLGLSRVEIGDTLANGTAIVTIDDSEALIVEFELPERAIGILHNDPAVQVSTPTFNGRFFEGDIISFDSRVDSATRSVTVRARIENPDGLLWSGMTFAVQVTQASLDLPMVAATAITWAQSGPSIWIDRDGVAATVPVIILHRQDDRVWLDVDLPIGTMVVTEGALKLREGAAIVGVPTGRPDAGGETSDPETTPEVTN